MSIKVCSHPVPTSLNPIGAKGAGEAGCIGALPAVANAVCDVLSRQSASLIDMPMTPQKIWRALATA